MSWFVIAAWCLSGPTGAFCESAVIRQWFATKQDCDARADAEFTRLRLSTPPGFDVLWIGVNCTGIVRGTL